MESKAKELFVSMPVIWFGLAEYDIEVPLRLGSTAPVYICPVYKHQSGEACYQRLVTRQISLSM